MTPAPVTGMAGTPARRRPLLTSLAAIAAISVLVSVAPAPGADLLREAAHNAGHVIVFAIVGYLLRPMLSARWPTATAIAVATTLLAATVLGALTEAAQSLLGGDPSLGDVLRDLWGAIVGVTASLASQPLAGRRARPLQALSAFGLLLGLLPLALTMLAYQQRDSRLPLLLDANVTESLAYARIGSAARSPSDRHVVAVPTPWAATTAEAALEIRLDEGPWPGLSIGEPAPDWRGHRALSIDLVNPQPHPLDIQLRLDDDASGNESGQRHDESFVLAANARQRIEIPLQRIATTPSGRTLDLARIRKLIVYHDGPRPGERFLVVGLRLER